MATVPAHRRPGTADAVRRVGVPYPFTECSRSTYHAPRSRPQGDGGEQTNPWKGKQVRERKRAPGRRTSAGNDLGDGSVGTGKDLDTGLQDGRVQGNDSWGCLVPQASSVVLGSR